MASLYDGLDLGNPDASPIIQFRSRRLNDPAIAAPPSGPEYDEILMSGGINKDLIYGR